MIKPTQRGLGKHEKSSWPSRSAEDSETLAGHVSRLKLRIFHPTDLATRRPWVVVAQFPHFPNFIPHLEVFMLAVPAVQVKAIKTKGFKASRGSPRWVVSRSASKLIDTHLRVSTRCENVTQTRSVKISQLCFHLSKIFACSTWVFEARKSRRR